MNMETSDIVQPKKRRVQQYSNKDLANAMCAVNDGRMNLTKASAHFKIPRTTLSTKIKLGETTFKSPGPISKVDDKNNKVVSVLDEKVPHEFIKSEDIATKPEIEFGETIKKEVEWCIACMHESNLSSTPELVSTYKELLGRNVDDGIHPKFCSTCSSFLQDIQNFKMTCLNSLSRLFENVFAEPLKCEEKFQAEETFLDDDNHFEDEMLTKIEVQNKSKWLKKKKEIKKRAVLPKKQVIAKQNKVTMPKQETDHCNLCQTTVPSLMFHILDQHTTVLDQTYSNCNICNTKILAKTAWKHFRIHNNRFDEPKACETCGKKFLEVYRYKKHQEIHTNFECDHCGNKANSRRRIKRHILTKHLSVKCCYHCKEFFYDIETYQAHMAWEKKTRPNASRVCDICGFEAANKISLYAHTIRLHTSEPVSCDKCGKAFKSRLALKEHHKQNHEELRFACEFCGKKFVAKRPLKLHIQSVHDHTNYVECDICGKSLRAAVIKYHKRVTHSNVYKFECKLCGRVFKLGALLKKHYYSHVNKRPFNCHLCSNAGYYMTSCLKKHYQGVHGLIYTTQEVRGVMREVILNEAQVVGAQV